MIIAFCLLAALFAKPLTGVSPLFIAVLQNMQWQQHLPSKAIQTNSA